MRAGGCRVLAAVMVFQAWIGTGAVWAGDDDLVFVHHSCGRNWLNNSLNTALLAKAYIDERNDIYYGTAMDADTGRPSSLGGTPGDNTDMHHWIRWFNDYLEHVKVYGCADGTNRIIMFKSCYPNSNIGSDGTEPGDPFSSTKTLANYKAVYRKYNAPGGTYTNGGYVYRPLEDVFAAHPDILFIPVTAPPRHYAPSDATTDAEGHRARVFNNWLKGEWLDSYNSNHPGYHNVAVFDWFDVLAYGDGATSHPNRLRAEYGGESGDSHPNSTANATSTWFFATVATNFLDSAWEAFTNQDVDADGMPDWWERDHFGSTSNSDGTVDHDGDRQCDRDEYLAGTDPTNVDSVFVVTGLVVAADESCRLSWKSAQERKYVVERATDLTGAGFSCLASNIAATPPVNVYTDPAPPAGGCVYRLRTAP